MRLVIGIALIAYAFFSLASPMSAMGLGAIAVEAILAVTGLISWRPIWAVLGVSTRKTNA